MSLSFQDHPPAVFFIQHWFFRIFGETAFVALLPSAVAGICSLALIYWGISQLFSKEAALWAALLLAADAFATHMFTNGFHEGVESVFIVASFISLLFYFQRKKSLYLYLGACALGLSIISKYTAIFAAAGFGVMLLSDGGLKMSLQRIFQQKWRILFAVLLILFTLSPALIYNFELFRTTHLFDSAFASMVGAQSVFDTKTSFDLPGNMISTLVVLINCDFPPFVVAACAAFVWLFVKYLRKETTAFERGLFIYTSFLFFMFACMGGSNRHEPIFQPFLAMTLAVGITDIRRRFDSRIVDLAVSIFFLLGLAFSLNTHLLPQPLGVSGMAYSEQRGHDFGLNELDARIRDIVGPLPALETPETISDIYKLGLPTMVPPTAKAVIIFDARFEFFALWWQLERYALYHHVSLYPTSAPVSIRMLGGGWFDRSVLPSPQTPVYYIYVVNRKFMDPHVAQAPWPDVLSQLLDENHFPYETIDDLSGEPMFRIYKLNP